MKSLLIYSLAFWCLIWCWAELSEAAKVSKSPKLPAARGRKNTSQILRWRSGDFVMKPQHDFVTYLFFEDDTYYSGVLLSEDVVATYQDFDMDSPRICFDEDCSPGDEKYWRSGQYQFWRLTEKRTPPSISDAELDQRECYLPPELGRSEFTEFTLGEDDDVSCHGHCMSGDAIICGEDLYGMLSEQSDDNPNEFQMITVSELKQKAGIAVDKKFSGNTRFKPPNINPGESSKEEYKVRQNGDVAVMAGSPFIYSTIVLLLLKLVVYVY